MTASLSKKERVRCALRREPLDSLPAQTNYTTPMGVKLAAYFGCAPADLSDVLDNHLLRLDLSHPKRLSPDQKISYDWWGAGWDTQTEGYWHACAPLAASADLAGFAWPDPNEPGLLEGARAQLAADGGVHFAVPNFGFALFERAWSLRGFDQLLIDMATEPTWVEELLERITEIQVTVAQRFVALGVDGGYFGDDYGAQRGLLFSPRWWRQLIKPRLARLFAVFRDAGLPVVLHSDGDIWSILPDLVDIGLNGLNPVQPEVLEHQRLHRELGKHLCFYGGISTQDVLPHGTQAQVRAAALGCLRDLAPAGTGLIAGPSHRLQSDIPLENVAAMLAAFPGTQIHDMRKLTP